MLRSIYHNIRYFSLQEALRKLKYGTLNLIKWFPVIWNDRDWDHVYLLTMIQKKMEYMSKLHETKGNKESTQDTANELNYLVWLIERIVKDNYVEIALGDRSFLLDKKKLDIVNNRFVTLGISESEHKEIRMAYRKAEELREADIAVLFDTMKSDIENWWD